MTLKIVLLLLSLVALPLFSLNTTITYWTRSPANDNRIYQDHLLWVVLSRSRLHCASRCAQDAKCAIFTVTKSTSEPTLCRGHSQEVTTSPVFDSGEDTALYRLLKREGGGEPTDRKYYLGSAWLTKPCSEDSECGPPNSTCFENRCLCLPGFFFSETKDSCQAECGHLQDQFVEYPLWYVAFNNLDEGSRSFQQCVEWCTSLPVCVTLEFNYLQSWCFVSSVTARDKQGSWLQADFNISYWQRTCL